MLLVLVLLIGQQSSSGQAAAIMGKSLETHHRGLPKYPRLRQQTRMNEPKRLEFTALRMTVRLKERSE